MPKIVFLAVALIAFWFAMSDLYKPIVLALGAGSILFVLILSRRMEVADEEGLPMRFGARAILYWPWLAKEIVLSSLRVCRIILSPRMAISPAMAVIPAPQKSTTGRVTYANSITLTPGTLTLALEGDEITVFALTKADLDSLKEGGMSRRASQFEGLGA